MMPAFHGLQVREVLMEENRRLDTNLRLAPECMAT